MWFQIFTIQIHVAIEHTMHIEIYSLYVDVFVFLETKIFLHVFIYICVLHAITRRCGQITPNNIPTNCFVFFIPPMFWNINTHTFHVQRMRTSYIIHCKLYIIHYTLCSIHFTLYIIQYTLYIVRYTLYIMHYTMYIIHYRGIPNTPPGGKFIQNC